MTRLIDASVVIKWMVTEVGSEHAMKLYGKDLAAPDLMLIELANILWKKTRQGEIGPVQAVLGLAEAQAMINIMPTSGLEARALEIALELGHPVYDCVYLALAEALDTAMVTADARLLRACTGTSMALTSRRSPSLSMPRRARIGLWRRALGAAQEHHQRHR